MPPVAQRALAGACAVERPAACPAAGPEVAEVQAEVRAEGPEAAVAPAGRVVCREALDPARRAAAVPQGRRRGLYLVDPEARGFQSAAGREGVEGPAEGA